MGCVSPVVIKNLLDKKQDLFFFHNDSLSWFSRFFHHRTYADPTHPPLNQGRREHEDFPPPLI